jgi:hypothetical protein
MTLSSALWLSAEAHVPDGLFLQHLRQRLFVAETQIKSIT